MDFQTQWLRQMKPYADRVARQTGIAPELILTRWAGETGWGKRVIPNTYNLGNVISTNGQGVHRLDNGNPRVFRQFKSFDDYADYEANVLLRDGGRYAAARNTSDPNKHFAVLKQQGYAEAPNYAQHMGRDMYNAVVRRLGGQMNTADPDVGNPIGVITAGTTKAPAMPSLKSMLIPQQKTAKQETVDYAAPSLTRDEQLLLGGLGFDKPTKRQPLGDGYFANPILDMVLRQMIRGK